MLTTNCSNNYGPFHFPEKLIPLMIVNALAGKPLPVYGDGQQVRDWLYVEDHCSAIRRVLEAGRLGETYNVGGWNEKPNIEIVNTVCALLDELRPRADGKSYREQITLRHRPPRPRPPLRDRRAQDRARTGLEAGRDLRHRHPQDRRSGTWRMANGWPTCRAAPTANGCRSSTTLRREGGGMKMLLFGKGGQVGWELQRSLAPLGDCRGARFRQHRLLLPTSAIRNSWPTRC